MSEHRHITTISTDDRIVVECACGESIDMPNKGLGRAMAAAFKSRHVRRARGRAK